MTNLSRISLSPESSTIPIRACALALTLALIGLFILPQIGAAQSKSATNVMTDSPVITGVQKATRQVAEVRDKQAIAAKIPMNGMLYITPELRYTVEASKIDSNLRIMFQAADGIIIDHVGTKPGQAKLVLRLVDGRTVIVNASAAKNKIAASYLIIR